MPRPIPARKPTFFWQGLLILLPVALLATIGVWALQKDRLTFEAQARERASELCTGMFADMEEYLTPVHIYPDKIGYRGTAGVMETFAIGHDNALHQPMPLIWPAQPESRARIGELSQAKLEQWTAAESAFNCEDWRKAAELYLVFLNGNQRLEGTTESNRDSGIGGVEWRPLALLRRGIAFEHLGQTNLAMQAYDDALVSTGIVVLRTESGLSISHLVALKILDDAHDDVQRLPERWRNNLEYVIAQLRSDTSPYEAEISRRIRPLIPALGVSSTRRTMWLDMLASWEREITHRKLYAEASDARAGDAVPWPDAFWVEGDFRWLCVFQGSRTNEALHENDRYFAVIPESEISAALAKSLDHADHTGNFAVRLQLSGRQLFSGGSPNTDWRNQTASASAQSTNLPLVLTVILADPPAFFAVERRRQLPFLAILLAAAATCVVGYILARQAFHRQLRLNEMKSDFVSSVSHELRAPIASVRLMAEGLERGRISEPGKQHEYFKFIVQECRRLSSLIENVLDFSRIEQGRKQYEMEPTDLVALAEKTVALMETYAEERQVRLTLKKSGAPMPVEMDGKAMQQALVNLIDNAIKHSPKGAEIVVGLEFLQFGVRSAECGMREGGEKDQPCSHGHVNMWVEDAGEGIAAAEHEKIFERFYRVGSELRRETQGVGIGLSIVKHIVEAHGGRVTVRSAPGQGSRFTIKIPANGNRYSDTQA